MGKLFMHSTKIEADKTVGEIQALLAKCGSSAIQIKFEDGEPSGITFCLNYNDTELYYNLPARWQPIFTILDNGRERSKQGIIDQSKRTCWRIILRWLQAQLAIIESNTVETAEVFMPYLQTPTGETMFERFKDKGMKLLKA